MLLQMAIAEEEEEVGERVREAAQKPEEEHQRANEWLSAGKVQVNIHICKMIHLVTSV